MDDSYDPLDDLYGTVPRIHVGFVSKLGTQLTQQSSPVACEKIIISPG